MFDGPRFGLIGGFKLCMFKDSVFGFRGLGFRGLGVRV